ncbi:MAG: peptide chain release factor N(5)-glutamine methyltransferase [Gammaproteobacteria bacterium]|nr:peptide chain release factor N(5)-glutamine methyltransferase [Gammaproteobacteria bacterium]NIR58775.1 peptide chain release factor N(5)-glutamine methyltransferase [Gammaproteobacteria bacterium]NIV73807.1 peptide chain release factor N(5)-glutamine methyltransferase [Gammaproteobacteria bacterium]
MTVAEALDRARSELERVSDTARLDAEVLLAHALDTDRAHLYAWPQRRLSDEPRERFRALLARRLEGWPVAYLTGHREFWSLDLWVDVDTLIPRPETELLVERTLARIPRRDPADVADLGTGCGAVALAIASERPLARVVGVEHCERALALARANLARLGLHNVELREGSWGAPLERAAFDVIATNPPYVASGDPHLDRGDLRFEPREALEAGPDGLAAIRTLAATAPSHLKPGGWLLTEHGADQGEAVRGLLRERGYDAVRAYRDRGDRERVTEGRWPNGPGMG